MTLPELAAHIRDLQSIALKFQDKTIVIMIPIASAEEVARALESHDELVRALGKVNRWLPQRPTNYSTAVIAVEVRQALTLAQNVKV